jgi:TonB family protein
LDSNGNVVDSQILESGGSNQLNQEALQAVRKMKFRVPGGQNRYTFQLRISFTNKGSDFDREARQRQAQNQGERQQREQERQAQLERERQEQLERERQTQLERERQEQQQQERQQRERERQIPPSSRPTVGLSCVSGCSPKYPAVLAGEEGSARVRLIVDRNGNVVDAQVLGGTAVIEFGVEPNGNVVPKAEETSIYSKLAEAALAAARQMKFTPPESGNRVAVIVNINFTIAGSEFGRQVRERRTQNGREGQIRDREVQLEELNLVPSE